MTPKGKEPAYGRDATDLLKAHRTHATIARIGSLNALAPGDYELRIRVTDRISAQQTATAIPFSILNPLPKS